MAISVVGTSTWTAALSGSGAFYDTMPIPTGTVSTDLLVLAGHVPLDASHDGDWEGSDVISPYASGFPLDIPDDRFGGTNYSASGTWLSYVGVGWATHTADCPIRVGLTSEDSPSAVAIMVALRGVDVGFDPAVLIFPTRSHPPVLDNITTASGGFALAFVADQEPSSPGSATVGTSSLWDNLDVAAIDGTYSSVSMRAFASLSGFDNLLASYDSNTDARFIAYYLDIDVAPPVVTTEAWLRQRQSPKANPRVSVHRPQLRQRQRFL